MKVHYLPGVLWNMFFRNKPFVTASNLHQTTTGWVCVLKCETTGQEYLMSLSPIESEVEVKKDLMYSDFEKSERR